MKKSKLPLLRIFYLLMLGFLVNANAADINNTEEWLIADRQVDCTGAFPQKCFLVKEANNGNWAYFYDSIEGFSFKENFTQKIQVEISKKKDIHIPADSSANKYNLVRVLNSTKTDGKTTNEALKSFPQNDLENKK